MRIALVSPYSWQHPGGVNRHVEALAHEFIDVGHEVRVLAPSAPGAAGVPDWLLPLGGTVPIPFNGATSNVTLSPAAVRIVWRELRSGGYDVVHVHEPVAAVASRQAIAAFPGPLVGTFHSYSENAVTHAFATLVGSRRLLNRLHVRIAVSEAAAWTGRRFFGGDYRIIPNGVPLPAGGIPAPLSHAAGEPLRILFVGQAVERKGLPVLLRAFETLRDRVPAQLTVLGVEPAELAPLLTDDRDVVALGRVDDAEKHRALADAHVLCAPSLGGESFGMVLTEAFGAGRPVIASDIVGYRGVVEHGENGHLVPAGDPVALAEALEGLARDPATLARLGASAGRSATRYGWPLVAAEIMAAYEDAIALPSPEGMVDRAAVRTGLRPADGGPRRPARRLPSLEPRTAARAGSLRVLRRAGALAATLATVAGSWVALERIGWNSVAASVLASSPALVLLSIALMSASLGLRAIGWHAILRANPATAGAELMSVFRATSIGVLMSATLPARLGEVSRAVIVARRLGRVREQLPAVLGTIVSQTVLNLLALAVLGTVMFSSTSLFSGHEATVLAYAIGPAALIAGALLAPVLLRALRSSQSSPIRSGLDAVRSAVVSVRSGLLVFRSLRYGSIAGAAQLAAWGLQLLACDVLLEAVGLDDQGANLAAAAGVLFAVNVTAVLPLTPSNLGVFQAACVAVLTAGYGTHAADALGYGIILQAAELATAIAVGAPSLVGEGLTRREMRLRALSSTPIKRTRSPARRTQSDP